MSDMNDLDSRTVEVDMLEPNCDELPKAPASKPSVSIIIPTCNRVEELRNLLVSALAQTVPVEIHVMDDAGNDATAEMIHREFPQVRYHRLGTGRGPASSVTVALS